MQPLVTDHAYDPHMKAKDVPLSYGVWWHELLQGITE